MRRLLKYTAEGVFNLMDSSQLTFVVQGPVYVNLTAETLASIRRNFTDSEIILSTWEGAPLTGLDYDILVLSRDPGSYCMGGVGILLNINRQIISTRNGLDIASRPYCVKVRSDLKFTSNKLLDLLSISKELNLAGAGLVGGGRIIVTELTTVNPRKYLQMPFHFCDWLYAGATETLRNLFNIDECPEESHASWFAHKKRPDNYALNFNSRYAAESYIVSAWYRRYFDLVFDHSYDLSNNNLEISERLLAEKFMVCSLEQIGITSLKFRRISLARLYLSYSFRDWSKLYKKYCGGKQPPLSQGRFVVIFRGAVFWLREGREFLKLVLGREFESYRFKRIK